MNKKIKVLVVDDDVPTRELYANVFREAGFEVVEAEDGVDGLDKATTQSPDVIFTGIVMPRMDGFSLVEALKKNLSTADIPVMISSHMGREEDRQKANVMGVKYFVVRGFTKPKEVVEKIKSLLMGGMEYRLEIDKLSLDGQKLAKDVGLNSRYQCLECNEELILKLIAEDKDGLRAHLICPSCGWQAK